MNTSCSVMRYTHQGRRHDRISWRLWQSLEQGNWRLKPSNAYSIGIKCSYWWNQNVSWKNNDVNVPLALLKFAYYENFSDERIHTQTEIRWLVKLPHSCWGIWYFLIPYKMAIAGLVLHLYQKQEFKQVSANVTLTIIIF